MSWAELERLVGLLSRFLSDIPALRPGDRLGVLGRNSVEYLQVNTHAMAALVLMLLNFSFPLSCALERTV